MRAVSWGPGRLDLFTIGEDGVLWHFWFDGQNRANRWESLGSPPFGLVGTPSAVSWGPGRLDVFAIKQDGGLWHQWWDGSWGPGESLGSPPGGLRGASLGAQALSAGAVSWAPGRLDVFAIGGASSNLWHIWYDAGPPTRPIASLTTNATSIQPGSSATLFWTTQNATSVTLEGSQVALDGSQTVSPQATTTYHLSASGPGGTQVATVTVNVTSSTCASGATSNTPLTIPTGAPLTGGNAYFVTDLTQLVPNNPCTLQLTSITNENNFGIQLLASGGSSKDCFSGSSVTVDVPAFQTTTSAQLQTLYGSQPPPFRMQIAGCVAAANAGNVTLGFGSKIP